MTVNKSATAIDAPREPAGGRAVAVSVVIPAYNAENDLPRCLDALAAQVGAPPFEVLVVDDGSNDGTVDVARRRGVRVLSQPNQGPAAARNHGAAESRGGILLFTDADCEPEGTWIREMLAAFDDATVDGALGAYRTRQRSIVARHLQAEFTYNYRKLERHGAIDHVPTHAAAYRATVFRDAGGFQPGYRVQEDVDLSYRLASLGKKLVFRPAARVAHRHPSTLAGYLRQKYLRAKWKVLLYDEHPGKIGRDSYTSTLLLAQLTLFLGVALFGVCGIARDGSSGRTLLAIATLLFAAFLATTLPLAMHAAKSDSIALGLFSPFFALLRTAAFAAGLVSGSLEWVRRKTERPA